MALRKSAKLVLDKIGNGFFFVGNRLYPGGKYKEFDDWFRDRGDLTHRLNYDLNENALVVDLGGYQGQWSSDIYSRFNCRVHVFEPAPVFFQYLKWRFAANPRITPHAVGLGPRDETLSLAMANDQSSLHNKSLADTAVKIQIVCADQYLQLLRIQEIDLLKINIEGAEYDLLEHLIQTQWIARIKNIQVQFHRFVPDAQSRREKIRKLLALSHRTSYDYTFVWENWVRNDVPIVGPAGECG